MSLDTQRPDDELLALLSQWQTGALGNDELRKRIEEIDAADLAPGQRAAVEDLVGQLRNALPGEREALEPAMREAQVALAYGS